MLQKNLDEEKAADRKLTELWALRTLPPPA
jgi:hypothetical protein